jgi:ribonuclease D
VGFGVFHPPRPVGFGVFHYNRAGNFMSHTDITTAEQLRHYCRRLADAKSIALDTEFVSENTYRPVLCLVQLNVDGRAAMIDSAMIDTAMIDTAMIDTAMIDAVAIEDMTPLWEAIAADGHETIVHAGRTEVEFCLQAVGRPPAGLFDVQLAAGLAGMDYPAGYGSLIGKLLGESPEKHETRTNWHRRPLSDRQIRYAMDDVLHLRPLRDTLVERLESLGRIDWLRQEMETWQEEVQQAFLREKWHKVSGSAALGRRSLAIVRELWRWREAEAERRNRPVRRVLRDDLIVELARRRTADLKRIEALRGMEHHGLKGRLGEIAAAIGRALDLPEQEWPHPVRRERTPESSVLGQFLFSALGSICREAHLAPALVGTPRNVRELISYRHAAAQRHHRHLPTLAQGWRAEVVGNLFDDLLSGKTSVRVGDATSEHPLVFEPTE